MQFWHHEDKLLTISTTAELSQKIIILVLDRASLSPYVIIAVTSA